MPDSSLTEPSAPPRSNFICFWISRVFSTLGFQIASVAVGWYVYDTSHSAYALGLLGLCQFAPMFLLAFVAGNAADRFDRRKIVLVCQIGEACILSAMALCAATHRLSVAAVFASMTLLGACRAFESPTLSSLLPALVSPAGLARAIAVSSSAGQTATILGPSAGGLLYGGGAVLPMAAAAVLFAGASLSIGLIQVRAALLKRPPVTLDSFFSGLRFVWQRPAILGLISLDLFVVLLGGVTALLPMFARDILHAGPWALGLLRSAPAVGAVAMSAFLSRRNIGTRVGIKMFAAVMVFGAATIVFSLSRNLALSLAMLLILGASDNVSVVIRSTLVQLSTPDEMRGRVNAVNSLFIGTSNQLGEFESGMTAGLLGPVGAGALGGAGAVLVALLWMRQFPMLRTLWNLTDADPDRMAQSA